MRNFQIISSLYQHDFKEDEEEDGEEQEEEGDGKKKNEEKEKEKMKFLDIEKVFEDLEKDESIESSEILITICQNHSHCGDGERRAFEILKSRLTKYPEVTKRVYEMLDGNQCTCTIKYGCKILTEVKDPNIFDFLIRVLPHDRRPFWRMGIPDCLALLGDKRCVPHLMEIVHDIDEEEVTKEKESPGFDDMSEFGESQLKENCLKTLIKFVEETEVQEFLRRGLTNPKYSLICASALVRHFGDEVEGEIMEKMREALNREGKIPASHERKLVLKILGEEEEEGEEGETKKVQQPKVVQEILEQIKLVEEREKKEKERIEKLKERFGGESGFSEVVKQGVCTYAITKEHHMNQKGFHCKTCDFTSPKVVCETCIKTCHEGHEVEEGNDGMRMYCDCGERGSEKCNGMKKKFVPDENVEVRGEEEGEEIGQT